MFKKQFLIIFTAFFMQMMFSQSVFACRIDVDNRRDTFSEPGEPCHLVGDPVNPVNGNMYLEALDYAVSSPYPINLTRYYNSQSDSRDFAKDYQPIFGKKWRSFLDVNLSFKEESICFHSMDGKRICFTKKAKEEDTGVVDLSLLQSFETYNSTDNTRLDLSKTDTGYNLKAGTTHYFFNAEGQLIQQVNDSGFSHAIHRSKDEITIRDQFGYQLTVMLNKNKQIERLALPNGSSIVYQIDAEGTLRSVKYPNGSHINYDYDDQDRLETVRDGQEKQVSKWEYDHENRVKYNRQIRDAGFEDGIFMFSYSNQSKCLNDNCKTHIALPRGGVYEYNFASGSALASLIDYTLKTFDMEQPLSSETFRHSRDCHVFPTAVQTQKGSRQTDYDKNGLLRKIVSPNEDISYQWHPFRLPKNVRDNISGLSLDFTYDNQHRPLSVSSADAVHTRTWHYTYTDQGFVKTVQAPHNDAEILMRYDYNARGQLKRLTNELGHVLSYDAYDDAGLLKQETDENGIQTTYSYDEFSLPKSITVNGATTLFNYDSNNLIQSITTPEKVKWLYDFNYWGDLRSITDALGNKLVQKTDPMGNIAQINLYDAKGKETYRQIYEYDSASRLRTERAGKESESVYLYHDQMLRPYRLESPSGKQSEYKYDNLDQIKSITRTHPKTSKTHHEITIDYDKSGRVELIKDIYEQPSYGAIEPKHINQSRYGYNPWGEVTEITTSAKGKSTFYYNAKGQIDKQQDAKGQVFIYLYDDLNRLTQVKNTTDQTLLEYSYDQGEYAIGRLSDVKRYVLHSDGHLKKNAIDNFYNAEGNISTQITSIDQKEYRTDYSYNKDQDIISITYPSGLKIHYDYDQAGNIKNIYSNRGDFYIAKNIEYLPFWSMTSMVYGNGFTLDRVYDLSYRLTDQTVKGVSQDHYIYNQDNNLISITYVDTRHHSKHYGYDVFNRLSSIKSLQEESELTYKNNNNLNHDGTEIKTQHDKNGNVIQLEGLTLHYDEFNNLVRLEENNKTTATYQYNAFNQRITKNIDGKTTTFIYDQWGKLVEIISPESTIDIIYHEGKPLAQITNGEIYYFINNSTGTPRILMDQQGQIQWQADIKGFEIEEPQKNIEQNLRFPGQYYDEESGFYYNNARYYHPRLGRYLQPEPLDVLSGGSFNAYTYAGNNPVNLIDPTGELPLPVIVPILIGVGGAIARVAKPLAKVFSKKKSPLSKSADKAKAIKNAPKAIQEETQAAKEGQVCGVPKKAGNYRPDRELPLDRHGNPVPDSDAPHTQLGARNGQNGEYTQAREWGYDQNGNLKPKRSIDFTDHGRPQNHPNPHQHDFVRNPTGGTPQRGPPKPLEMP